MFMNPQGPIGQVIGGYRIERMLGPGATGAVFLGQSVTSPQTQVAVKILVVPWNAPPEERANFQARFRHEAQALKQLNHPHILSILAFGEEQGMHYMVLPYMAGGTLAEYLKQRGGTLPLNEVASYLTRLASALEYAHKQNIIHRDIKPGNILLDGQGRPYLADFSIARLMDVLTKLTMTGQAMGTPAYMSPEQSDGKNVGIAADIYSLGVVVYEMVTGRLPFQANSLPEFIKKHANEPPPAPRLYRPDLPAAAEAVMLQALAKPPVDRFNSAGAFAQAFASGIQGQWAPGVRNPGSLTQQPTHVFTPPPTQGVAAPTQPRAMPPTANPSPQASPAPASIPPKTTHPPMQSNPGVGQGSGPQAITKVATKPPQTPPPAAQSATQPASVQPLYIPTPSAPQPRGRSSLTNVLLVLILLALLSGGGVVALGFAGSGPLSSLANLIAKSAPANIPTVDTSSSNTPSSPPTATDTPTLPATALWTGKIVALDCQQGNIIAIAPDSGGPLEKAILTSDTRYSILGEPGGCSGLTDGSHVSIKVEFIKETWVADVVIEDNG